MVIAAEPGTDEPGNHDPGGGDPGSVLARPGPVSRRRRFGRRTVLAFGIAVVLGGSAAGLAQRGGVFAGTSAPARATGPPVTAPASPATATSTPPISRDDAEAAFLVALNLRRTKLHLRPLVVDPHWVQVGRAWSAKMAAAEKLSHNPDLVASALPGWRKLGENVGVGGSVAALHQAFLDSPHHYENIADPTFNEVGIGVVVDHGTIWVTFDFEDSPNPPR